MRIKLIVSDIDGTLIPYGERDLPEALFPMIRALREKGVLFCPASGRQYRSLRRLFAPVADELAYLCENGAVVIGVGAENAAPLLSKTPMTPHTGGQGNRPARPLRGAGRHDRGDGGFRRQLERRCHVGGSGRTISYVNCIAGATRSDFPTM